MTTNVSATLAAVPQIKPNDSVRGMVASGANVLPTKVVERAFRGMHGNTLNFVHLKQAINKIDNWYSERGVLGQVSDFDVKEGVIRLECAEARVGSIKLDFIDPETQKPKAKPRTKPEVGFGVSGVVVQGGCPSPRCEGEDALGIRK